MGGGSDVAVVEKKSQWNFASVELFHQPIVSNPTGNNRIIVQQESGGVWWRNWICRTIDELIIIANGC